LAPLNSAKVECGRIMIDGLKDRKDVGGECSGDVEP
jgi:hypothetical protein